MQEEVPLPVCVSSTLVSWHRKSDENMKTRVWPYYRKCRNILTA